MLARQSNNPVVAVWRLRIAGLPRGTHYDECRAERGQGDIFYSHVGRAVLLSLPHPRHAGAAAHAGAEDAMIPSDVRNGIPYRRLGRTAERVPLVGVGGTTSGGKRTSRKPSASSALPSTTESTSSTTAGTTTAGRRGPEPGPGLAPRRFLPGDDHPRREAAPRGVGIGRRDPGLRGVRAPRAGGRHRSP